MFDINPKVPVHIAGKIYVLSFDLAAIACLKEDFGVSLEDFVKLASSPKGELKDPGLLVKLVYAFTRSNDEPPTLKQVERMAPAEVFALQNSLSRAFSAGGGFGLKKGSPASAKPDGTDDGSSSTGGSRSTKRSTGSSSRRGKRGG